VPYSWLASSIAIRCLTGATKLIAIEGGLPLEVVGSDEYVYRGPHFDAHI
jgi:hypothetical protein